MSVAALKDSLIKVAAGDQILFKRGDVIRDSFNLGAMPDPSTVDVTIGAYGTGNKPVITGAKVIGGWTAYQNGIMKATFAEPVAHLIVNGTLQTIARFPNTGYDSITLIGAGGKGSFGGYRLNIPGSGANGATAHFRIQNDVIDRGVIGTVSGSTATMSTDPGYAIRQSNGYYIDNKLALLDTAGEWVQEGSTVYFKPPAGMDLSGVVVEGMVLGCGIRANYKNRLIIRDLSVQAFKEVGIIFNPGTRYKIINCDLMNMGRDGVVIWGNNDNSNIDVVIDSCRFYDIFNNAIKGNNSSGNVVITNNILKRIGMVPGYEMPVMVAGQGMSINCSDSRFEGNVLDSIGYGGINAGGPNNVLLHNIIGNTGMSKNDCGPFQTWGGNSTNWLIKENICYNSWGNLDGMAHKNRTPLPHLSEGIYFDSYSVNGTVIGNTVWNTQDGIFIQASQNFVVRDNIAYNNSWNQMFLNELADGGGQAHDPTWRSSCEGYTIKNNILYSVRSSQDGLRISSDRADSPLNFGVYDSNYYFNPYRQLVVTRSIQPTGANRVDSQLTLAGWQKRSNQDAHTKTNWFSWYEQMAATTGTEKITNGTFTSDIAGWGVYQASISAVWENNPKLDGGSLKLTNTNEAEGDLSGNGFTFDTSKTYILKFSCVAGKPVTAKVLLWSVPNAGWVSNNYSFVADTTRKEIELVIDPYVYAAQAKLSFRTPLGSTIWFDNISVKEIASITPDNYLERSKLFVNDTRTSKTFTLASTTAWFDPDRNRVTGSITVAPYRSRILIGFIPDEVGVGRVELASSLPRPAFSASAVHNSVMIQAGEGTRMARVVISDLQGRVVFQRKAGIGTGEKIMSKPLARGSYVVRMGSGAGMVTEHVLVR